MSTAIERIGTRQVDTRETSSAAAAAQAQAMVQARHVIAMQCPRDWDNVRVRLLRECERPAFAEVAKYSVPRGNKFIEGPSIRFVEAGLRIMGNIYSQPVIVFDDETKRILRVTVTDLEANVTYDKDIMVSKRIERREVRKGQVVVAKRQNSLGIELFIVESTEDELTMKQDALVSKAIRTNGLRLIPGDLQEEAMAKCAETLAKKDADDPDAAKKRLADSFARIGVMPSDLKAFLGHDLAQTAPVALERLRQIFAAVRDGETSWKEVMDQKDGGVKPDKEVGGVAAAKERLRSKSISLKDESGAEIGAPPADDIPTWDGKKEPE